MKMTEFAKRLGFNPSQFERFVAYHEAGHAVANAHLHLPFIQATIIPSKRRLGAVIQSEKFRHYARLYRWSRKDEGYKEVSREQRLRERAKKQVIALWAGAEAAKLITTSDALLGASFQDDANQIQRIKKKFRFSTSEVSTLFSRTQQLVSRHTEAIKQVAEALLEHKTISAKTVRNILSSTKFSRLKRRANDADRIQHG